MLRNFKKFLFLENIVRNFSPFLFVNNGFHGYCLTFAPNMLLDSLSTNEVLFITINLIYFSNNQAVIKIITLPLLLSLFFVFFFLHICVWVVKDICTNNQCVTIIYFFLGR